MTADTGGFCAIPGSHRLHSQLCERSPSANSMIDFVMLEKNDPILFAGVKNRSADMAGGEAAVGDSINEEQKLMAAVDVPILVGAQAGDLILWDSRTVHCNSPALTVAEYFAKRQAEAETTEMASADAAAAASAAASTAASTATPEAASTAPADLIRLVAYVCMVPQSVASAEVLKMRHDGFRQRLATSHWPAQKIMTFDKDDEFCVNPADYPAEVRRLVGYDESNVEKCYVS